VVNEHPRVAQDLRADIPDRLVERDAEAPREPEGEVDREHLEALGYVELREDK